jgi:hypothetical protein
LGDARLLRFAHTLPPEDVAKRYVEFMGGADATLDKPFMGGADATLDKARGAFELGDYRWVAEVVNHVVFADPDNRTARELQADALEQLGYQAESGPWRNFYLTAATELGNGVRVLPTPNAASPDAVRSMSLTLFFDYLGVRLNGRRAGDRALTLVCELPDLGETWSLLLRHGALSHRHGAARRRRRVVEVGAIDGHPRDRDRAAAARARAPDAARRDLGPGNRGSSASRKGVIGDATGYETDRHNTLAKLRDGIVHIGSWDRATVLVTAATVAVWLVCRQLAAVRSLGTLVALVVGTVLVALADIDVPLAGAIASIPNALPAPHAPNLDAVPDLAVGAFAVALVALAQAAGIGGRGPQPRRQPDERVARSSRSGRRERRRRALPGASDRRQPVAHRRRGQRRRADALGGHVRRPLAGAGRAALRLASGAHSDGRHRRDGDRDRRRAHHRSCRGRRARLADRPAVGGGDDRHLPRDHADPAAERDPARRRIVAAALLRALDTTKRLPISSARVRAARRTATPVVSMNPTPARSAMMRAGGEELSSQRSSDRLELSGCHEVDLAGHREHGPVLAFLHRDRQIQQAHARRRQNSGDTHAPRLVIR